MKQRPTLRTYVKDIISPYAVSLSNAVRRLRTSVNELNVRIDNLPKTVDISRVVIHPTTTTPSITPDLNDGGIHEYTFNVATCILNTPTLPTDWDAGEVKLYMETTLNSTTITMGAGLTYVGGDGVYILNGQRYLMTIAIKDDGVYVQSKLVSG